MSQRRRGEPSTNDSLPIVDDPCWGSSTQCSIAHLVKILTRSEAILSESGQYIVLNKPPDLRMDGNYPSTVIKLLTFWYPPESLRKSSNLEKAVSEIVTLKNIKDNEIRPAHQLDYATSGVLLIGRTHEAAGLACKAFQDRTPTKHYLAIVHSHIKVNFPVLPLSLNDVYKTIRAFDKTLTDRRKTNKNKKQTFNGFQPVPSIFLKWKSGRKRVGKKRPRDDAILEEIESILSKADVDELDQAKSWSKVRGNAKWRAAFEQVAKSYNDSLRAEVLEQAEAQQMPALPRMFRLEEDSDPSIFYVNAALAEQTNTFAMKVDTGDKAAPEEGLQFKLSITKCQVLQSTDLDGSPVTKVSLQPLTGRRHQLRCHMAMLDASIVGDVTYETSKHPKLSTRMCLHAHRLKIPNLIDVEAPDPFPVNKAGSLEIQIIPVPSNDEV